VNQYWLHHRLLDNWGYKALARQWRKESIEEMQHADKLIERIIFLDGNPNMQTLESLRIGQTDEQALYEEAATPLPQCEGLRDARPLRATDAGRGTSYRFQPNST